MRKTVWFSARGLFRHAKLSKRAGKNVYEERGVLLRAVDFFQAMRLADGEARGYAKRLPGAEFLGYLELSKIEEDAPNRQDQRYSSMRSTNLDPEQFLTRYLAVGA
jgi:hypothetical protein